MSTTIFRATENGKERSSAVPPLSGIDRSLSFAGRCWGEEWPFFITGVTGLPVMERSMVNRDRPLRLCSSPTVSGRDTCPVHGRSPRP
jgi:hypothetical protein